MSVMRNSSDPEDGPRLISEFAVQPVQQAAAAEPALPTHVLTTRKRLSANRLARMVNDLLADPSVH